MGRRKKAADHNGDIKDEKHVSTPNEAVAERLGLTKQICTACNARNDEDADKCRKCGHTGLRQKASDYRDA